MSGRDPWEDLRFMTVDELVTSIKLEGPAGSLQGFTTPEGWPFVVVVAIARPGSEVALDLALEFHEKLSKAGAPLKSVAQNPNLRRP